MRTGTSPVHSDFRATEPVGGPLMARPRRPRLSPLTPVSIDPVLVAQISLIGVVFLLLQISAAVLVYFERKIAAWAQQRRRSVPGRPLGLLQPLADIVKLIFKEELRPKAADKWLFYLAPMISATTAFAAFAVIPFGAATDAVRPARPEPMPLQVADVNVARAGGLCDHLDGHLRHRAGRLGQQQQVLAARRPAQRRRR